MKLKVLGCSGGIGHGLHTTSFLVDEKILIDAGTGVGNLPIKAMTAISDIFLTHAHFDHIACLPMLLDTTGALRGTALKVHGHPDTLDALDQHIFNHHIWPDFRRIPNKHNPWLSFHPITTGESHRVGEAQMTALPANHTVPALGYQIQSATGTIVYSGDTTFCAAFWEAINQIDDLKYLLIEAAFPDKEAFLAELSSHFSPKMLGEALQHLKKEIQIYGCHFKPDGRQQIEHELHGLHRKIQSLHHGQELSF